MKLYSLIIFFCFIYLDFSFAQNTFVFIGSYNYDEKKDGLFVYELDTISGQLTKMSSLNNVYNPSFFTLSHKGDFLFSCTDTRLPDNGSVSGFKFNSITKKLSFVSSQKTLGENPVYVALDKSESFLLSANYTDGSVTVFPIDKNGTIVPPTQFIQYTDSSIDKERQERSHTHATVFSPDGEKVFIPDLGSDKIRCYSFDNTNQKPLTALSIPYISTVAGSGPRHLIFHPNGKFAYCIEELSGSLSVYKYAQDLLKKHQTILAHPKKLKAEFSSADIHISPDGKFLYASNRGEENNIVIYAIRKNGKLKITGYQSTFGTIPRNFAIDESGKFLIVANQKSGNIVTFRRNSISGKLEKIASEIYIENPTCVNIKKYSY